MSIAIELLPAINLIISKAESDLRELTGAPVTLIVEHGPTEVNKSTVQYLVCKTFEVSWSQITGKGRQTEIVDARHAYIWLALSWLKENTVTLGRQLNRDHSTVICARDRVKNMIVTKDKLMVPKIEAIENILRRSKQ